MKIDLEWYNDQWQRDVNGPNFRGIADIELGDQSLIIARAWLKIVSNYGKVSYTAFADVEEGKGVKNIKRRTQDDDDFWELPPGTRMVRLEGRRDRVDTLVSASILPLAK